MSEDKDKMHLAELEQDVLGDRSIPFTESLCKNYRELASTEIENLMQQRETLQDRIKELEEKLNKCMWKPIALVELEGAKCTKGQKFDLWIKDLDIYPTLREYSYILSNLTWCHEEGRWFTSSDEYLSDIVYRHATHARPVFTPPTKERGKE